VHVEYFMAGTSQWNEYLIVGGKMIGVRFERSDSTVSTRYFVRDHLGSVAVLTDENALVVERLSYDAWGKRRFPDGTDDPAGSITSQTSRGFTGQEELTDVGLVHLNGRVYDPPLGRMMTAGPSGAGSHQCAGLEPLQLRHQQSAELHRPQRLLLPRPVRRVERDRQHLSGVCPPVPNCSGAGRRCASLRLAALAARARDTATRHQFSRSSRM
jgi:RHS repeat-associated protein